MNINKTKTGNGAGNTFGDTSKKDVLKNKINRILYKVRKPAAYINGELNTTLKDPTEAQLKIALCYPDVYEIGQSNIGLSILYEMINEDPDLYADRVYIPRSDMQAELVKANIPLFSLKLMEPVRDLDVLGFTLQSELTYTNLLRVLDLSRIPLLAQDRQDAHPIVMAGGPLVYNPEPLREFIDVFFIGEADAVDPGNDLIAVLKAIRSAKAGGAGREEILRSLFKYDFLYIPKYYDTVQKGSYFISEPGRSNNEQFAIPPVVKRKILSDINLTGRPKKPIVPFIETQHDRLNVEIMRGCTRGCRFCYAGMIYRPFREKDAARIEEEIEIGLNSTGHSEFSLASLSTSDYSCIRDLSSKLSDKYRQEKIAMALPSLRLDSFDIELAQKVAAVKRTGLTFAPEAGSKRMREVINKNLDEQDLMSTMEDIFRTGWFRVKLYFMIGLPYETDEDIDAIADLAFKVLELGLSLAGKAQRNRLKIVINVAGFVPKPHTPFQWVGMATREAIQHKISILKEHFKYAKQIDLKWHDPKMSEVEGLISRGDAISGELILLAYEGGALFDQWSEYFNYDIWVKAAQVIEERYGTDLFRRTYEPLDEDSALPWEIADPGIDKDFLLVESKKAFELASTEDCRTGKCTLCGVCMRYKVSNITAKDSLDVPSTASLASKIDAPEGRS